MIDRAHFCLGGFVNNWRTSVIGLKTTRKISTNDPSPSQKVTVRCAVSSRYPARLALISLRMNVESQWRWTLFERVDLRLSFRTRRIRDWRSNIFPAEWSNTSYCPYFHGFLEVTVSGTSDQQTWRYFITTPVFARPVCVRFFLWGRLGTQVLKRARYRVPLKIRSCAFLRKWSPLPKKRCATSFARRLE